VIENHPKGMHYITKCKKCDIIIAECNCVDPYKVILYEMCDKCRQENTKLQMFMTIWR
jgi:hypothetical protein